MVDDDPRRNEPGHTEPLPAEDPPSGRAPEGDAVPEDTGPVEPEPTQPSGEAAPGIDATQYLGGKPTVPGSTPPAGPSGTGVLPPVPAGPTEPRWSARAQVPTPTPDQEEAYDYWAPDEQQPRGVLGPVLIAVSAVVLLAVLAVGLWLVLRGRPAGTPTPVPSTATTATTRPTTPTVTRTTPPAPTTTQAVPVGVPDLHGLDYATAADKLTKLGFVAKRADEPSITVAAGKVIDTDPPAGNTLLPGTTIVVNVSTGSPTTAPPTSAGSPS